jgi:hypothetical protein
MIWRYNQSRAVGWKDVQIPDASLVSPVIFDSEYTVKNVVCNHYQTLYNIEYVMYMNK